jgi:hypothetical protein
MIKEITAKELNAVSVRLPPNGCIHAAELKPEVREKDSQK